MTPPNQPQEQRVTLVMLYEKLEEIGKSISAIDKAQAVNETNIKNTNDRLGEMCEEVSDLRKRSDKWDAVVAAVSLIGASLAAIFGANK